MFCFKESVLISASEFLASVFSKRLIFVTLGFLDYFVPPKSIGLPGKELGSAGKESTCNVGDLGLIPGLEDLLKKGKVTHSSVLAWRIP